jgi:hypothetical protein
MLKTEERGGVRTLLPCSSSERGFQARELVIREIYSLSHVAEGEPPKVVWCASHAFIVFFVAAVLLLAWLRLRV